jgi:hypothetical protein
LNLCPFAKAVHVKRQIAYHVSDARSTSALRSDVQVALQALVAVPATETDTALLIHPYVLNEFLDFNDFLAEADALLSELDLEGEIQIASFHPDYQFADAQPDDITNYTNRSPYPTLHLIREASISRVLESFPDPDSIYEKNMETLKGLGLAGWRKLFSD